MLNDIKLAIFDFDDTLAIHNDKKYREHREKLGKNNYYKNAFEHPDIFYDKIEPCEISENIRNLICYLGLHNVKMFCLSGMHMSLHYDAKQTFINKNYGKDIKLLSACTQERKIDVVKILQESFHCKPHEILFIDDVQMVVDLMKQQGYMAILEKDVGKLENESVSLIELVDD